MFSLNVIRVKSSAMLIWRTLTQKIHIGLHLHCCSVVLLPVSPCSAVCPAVLLTVLGWSVVFCGFQAYPLKSSWRSLLLEARFLAWNSPLGERVSRNTASRRNTCLSFNWISRKHWGNCEYVQWATFYEGVKRPVNRHSRLLVVRCGVSSPHRWGS